MRTRRQPLAFCFQRLHLVARVTLDQRATPLRYFDAFAQLEGVIVGDDDLRTAHLIEHVVGHDLSAGVIAVRIVRLQDAQPVLDRQAGRADQKPAREGLAAWPPHRIDRLPCNQHGHDRGLACAGRELRSAGSRH